MDKLKICFVGIGSIAKRHIPNLRQICIENGVDLQIDAIRHCYEQTYGVDVVYTRLDMVPNDYDALFITNPTEMHLSTLEVFHDKAKHFFIEKPIVSLGQIERARRFELRKESIYYVACPLRYNAVIQWVHNNVDPNDVISIRSISSSYLPDWRPGQDYRDTYSAHKEMGGGVSIDLIHEWDYLTYLFGFPDKVCSMIGKKSHLEINSDDYSIYIAEYKDKIAELHLDYFGRKTIREIELFTNTDTILGDLTENRIAFLQSGRVIDFKEERDDYQRREIIHFLDLIEGRTEPCNDFSHGVDVLELTQGIIHRELV